ncbi:MAG: formate dehydrogenase subunit gamma [Actinobacteria bacterium]|nr:formate dehydrogenase subunit gamma [Actinomycetota bacterium]
MAAGAGATRPAWSAEQTRAIVAAHQHLRAPLLPVLHAIQAEFGYIDPQAIPVLAGALNLSRAEVHGVVTFYRDFRTAPPGAVRIRICRAEACQAVGAERLAEVARRRLGVAFDETTADGSVTLEEVFCLGNCALGPSVLVGDRLVGRVDESGFEAMLSAATGSPR